MSKVPLHQVAAVLADKSFSAKEIAAYLLETGRTGELNSLTRDIVKVRAERGIVEATVVSAREITPGVRDEMTATVKKLFPEAKQIILNERIDANIIGGVRMEFPDSQLDLSIRNKLNRFKALTTSERTA
ncbi:MAG TPA: F0F1 ATP synthase subunit delta [Candidatus Saccharimonadales bacterium]|nr:F0F1 ATP synthase subunit delta [Candidatus Saccharimonadales bacterium]